VLIDWFTVIAQIINFLVLMALMKFLLFDRIISAVDKRETSIRQRLDDARQEREQAQAKNRELQQKEKELQTRREKVLDEARAEAEKRRRQLQQRARREAEQRKAQWLESLQAQKEQFLQSFAELAADNAVEMARKAVQDLAGADLNAQAAQAFVLRLQRLPEDEVQDFDQGLQATGGEVQATCSFNLPETSRREIEKALAEAMGRDVAVAWEQSTELGLGLSLKAGGRVLSWSLDDSLQALRDQARQAIDNRLQQSRPGRSENPAEESGEAD
jgi:F-type H+-transporting ATPase subunit b